MYCVLVRTGRDIYTHVQTYVLMYGYVQVQKYVQVQTYVLRYTGTYTYVRYVHICTGMYRQIETDKNSKSNSHLHYSKYFSHELFVFYTICQSVYIFISHLHTYFRGSSYAMMQILQILSLPRDLYMSISVSDQKGPKWVQSH